MEKVKLILGTINSTGKVFFWKNEKSDYIDVDDYAIVENINGYDLIKVIGKVETTKKNIKKVTGKDYKNLKNVLLVIGEKIIKGEQQEEKEC